MVINRNPERQKPNPNKIPKLQDPRGGNFIAETQRAQRNAERRENRRRIANSRFEISQGRFYAGCKT
jgi:hypothetical protein